MAVEFEYLYYFANDSAAVVEAKITNLEQDAPPGRVYHWLYVRDTAVQKLQFKAMREADGRNFREFAQGDLVFDGARATLRLDGAAIELAVGSTAAVPADLDAAVRAFLKEIP